MFDLVSGLPLGALLGGLVGSVVLVALLVRLAPGLRLLAHANERSSHVRPTPTGGGIAIAVPLLVWCAFSPEPFGRYLAVGGGVLALVGLIDDLLDLPALFRFLSQISVIGWFISMAWPEAALSWQLVTGLGMLWFVNLFNFMDGIDGLAASQSLLYCLGVLLLTGAMLTWTESLLWMIAGACLGFLLFNWPPARVFMGDAGALLLGLLLPAVAIELERTAFLPIAVSLLLLVVLVFDASWTLGVRVITGQKFTSAHRSHLYQRLAIRYGHLRTTSGFIVYFVVVQLPLAWLMTHGMVGEIWILATAIVPLLLLSLMYSAGKAPNHIDTADKPDTEAST